MEEQTELLKEMVDLLTLIAEPQIALRDEKRRNNIAGIVGKSAQKIRAVQLMDGTRQQAAICKEAKIDPGALSRLTKSLRESCLLDAGDGAPKLTIKLPQSFWDTLGGAA